MNETEINELKERTKRILDLLENVMQKEIDKYENDTNQE